MFAARQTTYRLLNANKYVHSSVHIDRRDSYLSFLDLHGLVACKLREEVDAEVFELADGSLLNGEKDYV